MLRKILLGLFLLLLPGYVSAQVATVTGHVIFPSSGVPTNVQACFSLQNYKPNVPRITGIGTIVQQTNWCISPSLIDGSFSTPIIRNDFISPAGTFWHISYIWDNIQQSGADWLVNANPFNLDTQVPLSAVTPVGPAVVITQSFVCPFTASTVWLCSHGFNDANILAEAYDLTGVRIFPNTLTITSPNAVTLTWVTPQTGIVVVMHAGSVSIATNQPNALLQNPLGAQVVTGGFPLTISAPTTFNFQLIPPLKLDPVSPITGEFWMNLGILKYRGNEASPATHTISTSLPGTCPAGQIVNAILPDVIPGCVAFSLASLPLTSMGDILSVDVTPTLVRVPGNITATKLFFTQTGTGSVSALPGWNPIVSADLPQVPVSKLNNGTLADGTHFWRGDGVWAVPTLASTTAIQSSSRTVLGADIPVTANTTTTILTVSVVMPSSGCPCRVFASYGMYYTFLTGVLVSSTWVSDGSVSMASSSAANASNINGAGVNASEFSNVTYANSANITFTLVTRGNAGFTVQHLPAGGGVSGATNTWLNLVVMPSL